MHPNYRMAFTLIELLMVMSIISMLAGLTSAVATIGQRSGRATHTRTVLKHVDTALRLFKEEVGVYPYANPPGVSPTENDLGWRLTHAMTTSEHNTFRQDLAHVAMAYRSGTQRLTAVDVDDKVTYTDERRMHAGMINRLGEERARLAVFAGHTGVTGIGPQRTVPVLVAPVSRGWANDYLAKELARFVIGDQIVDPYGTPLIYVCPVVPGMVGTMPVIPLNAFLNKQPIHEDHYGLGPVGRIETLSLAEDMRTTAAKPFIREFELWSAGPDRQTAFIRSENMNHDNVAVTPYIRNLR